MSMHEVMVDEYLLIPTLSENSSAAVIMIAAFRFWATALDSLMTHYS